MAIRESLFDTPRLRVITHRVELLPTIQAYYRGNAAHLAPWEPQRPADYHSDESWRARLAEAETAHAAGTALLLAGINAADGTMIAACNFTNIARGPLQAEHLGYSVAKSAEGTGIMHELLSASLTYVFDTLDLHRVMANHLPENERSAALLERLGFEREGYARSYLKIAGVWRDHVLRARINPRHA